MTVYVAVADRNDAQMASCRKVQLLSHKRRADDGAHAFYRSLGFQPEPEGFRLYLGP
jgi:hypothetical protein